MFDGVKYECTAVGSEKPTAPIQPFTNRFPIIPAWAQTLGWNQLGAMPYNPNMVQTYGSDGLGLGVGVGVG